ncbi:hypothetical protein ABZ930_39905 [Streptomyces sp. NPDC046716]|uniref:hypothetical protein n=1 Tax=Streptomyces sp. NPDC046716 TaxID=3157093 RepID=UPI0033EE8C58
MSEAGQVPSPPAAEQCGATSVEATGERAVAVGRDLGLALTGDHNTINQYFVFGTGDHGSVSPATPRIRAVVPVLIGLINWVGQAASVHPGRRLVRSYVEQALRETGGPNVVGYGEEQGDDGTLLLFTGATDLIELGAALLTELDRMMSEDWTDITHRPGYLLPQLRLVLHTGHGEYDGSRISSPALVGTIRAHARTTSLNDAYAGDAVGVVALVTNEAFDADVYDRLNGSGYRWLPFSQHMEDVSPLGFWTRGARGAAAAAPR